MLTIFTPTYNRAYTLPILYDSLCKQTQNSFVWLIVDDGSKDNTKELIENWQKEGKITIKYYFQENQGKSAAHNTGVEMTETELFTCVDSDDFLVSDAVEVLLRKWKKNENHQLVGIIAQKGTKQGKSITNYTETTDAIMGLNEIEEKKIVKGDMMFVYRTDLLRKYYFPKFENEKFVPEAYLNELIRRDGVFYVIPEILYIAEYLEDGYSKNMAKTIVNNPNGYIAFITERLKFDKRLKNKILDTIRYIAICISAKKEKIIRKAPYPLITFVVFPLGYLFYCIRYKKIGK